ncbi:hypothetical protein [Rubellicoccus peritrichatus]|uniref:Uncharacterized protein n=1 Tax=Rubellicoccus peritrichatus TaxID=3080537 RepID=A0AAQ3LH07_9BACT|nr:hypothetical protein [Puniceicoccus sp. CR14]WOO43663.1 hypothetical protein RZN69_11235 [Puniceicoccus sp. CR14]
MHRFTSANFRVFPGFVLLLFLSLGKTYGYSHPRVEGWAYIGNLPFLYSYELDRWYITNFQGRDFLFTKDLNGQNVSHQGEWVYVDRESFPYFYDNGKSAWLRLSYRGDTGFFMQTLSEDAFAASSILPNASKYAIWGKDPTSTSDSGENNTCYNDTVIANEVSLASKLNDLLRSEIDNIEMCSTDPQTNVTTTGTLNNLPMTNNPVPSETLDTHISGPYPCPDPSIGTDLESFITGPPIANIMEEFMVTFASITGVGDAIVDGIEGMEFFGSEPTGSTIDCQSYYTAYNATVPANEQINFQEDPNGSTTLTWNASVSTSNIAINGLKIQTKQTCAGKDIPDSATTYDFTPITVPAKLTFDLNIVAGCSGLIDNPVRGWRVQCITISNLTIHLNDATAVVQSIIDNNTALGETINTLNAILLVALGVDAVTYGTTYLKDQLPTIASSVQTSINEQLFPGMRSDMETILVGPLSTAYLTN